MNVLSSPFFTNTAIFNYLPLFKLFDKKTKKCKNYQRTIQIIHCAADFSLLNLPKGKSLGRSKPATNS